MPRRRVDSSDSSNGYNSDVVIRREGEENDQNPMEVDTNTPLSPQPGVISSAGTATNTPSPDAQLLQGLTTAITTVMASQLSQFQTQMMAQHAPRGVPASGSAIESTKSKGKRSAKELESANLPLGFEVSVSCYTSNQSATCLGFCVGVIELGCSVVFRSAFRKTKAFQSLSKALGFEDIFLGQLRPVTWKAVHKFIRFFEVFQCLLEQQTIMDIKPLSAAGHKTPLSKVFLFDFSQVVQQWVKDLNKLQRLTFPSVQDLRGKSYPLSDSLISGLGFGGDCKFLHQDCPKGFANLWGHIYEARILPQGQFYLGNKMIKKNKPNRRVKRAKRD